MRAGIIAARIGDMQTVIDKLNTIRFEPVGMRPGVMQARKSLEDYVKEEQAKLTPTELNYAVKQQLAAGWVDKYLTSCGTFVKGYRSFSGQYNYTLTYPPGVYYEEDYEMDAIQCAAGLHFCFTLAGVRTLAGSGEDIVPIVVPVDSLLYLSKPHSTWNGYDKQRCSMLIVVGESGETHATLGIK